MVVVDACTADRICSGFRTDGYMLGSYCACDLADQLFEVGQPHRLGEKDHPTELPSGRCLAHRSEFSKAKLDEKGQFDVGAYTDVITAF